MWFLDVAYDCVESKAQILQLRRDSCTYYALAVLEDCRNWKPIPGLSLRIASIHLEAVSKSQHSLDWGPNFGPAHLMLVDAPNLFVHSCRMSTFYIVRDWVRKVLVSN